LGAYLSAASVGRRQALRDFGMALGTAYQVFDDCLDLFGSEDSAGKSLGTDLARGKVTLPLLVLLERNDLNVRAKLQSLLGDWQPENFSPVIALLQRHGALHESRRVIQEYLAAAKEFAAVLPDSESRAGLIGLCDVLAAQTDLLGGAD